MPNTLAHYGIQGALTRAVLRGADLQWLLTGCVIPDLPWVLQRAVRWLDVGVDPTALRGYCLAQGSLAVCLLLCGALALVSTSPRGVFLLLGSNCALHLLLDACEIKWANGVHLFAPLSWKMLRFGLFWPESPTAYALTLLGLGVVVRLWRHRKPSTTLLHRPSVPVAVAAGALVLAWVAAPLALREGPLRADNQSMATLLDVHHRPGRLVEFDRMSWIERDGRPYVVTYTGEELPAVGAKPSRPGIVSARARFVDERTIEVLELHEHHPWLRDASSYAGLVALALCWILPGARGSGLASRPGGGGANGVVLVRGLEQREHP